jgi:hypothetical protein
LSATEKHYTVVEVAELWQVNVNTIRSIFADVPGVLRIGHGETLHKRSYVTLRIPQSVLDRVHADRCRKIA